MGCLSSQFLGCVIPDREAVKTLREMEKEAKAKEESLAKDEHNFQKLKNRIQHRRLKRGTRSVKIRKRFGSPVAILAEHDEKRWLYKGTGGGWFSSPKIYLFFDKTHRLKEWSCIRTNCETVESIPRHTAIRRKIGKIVGSMKPKSVVQAVARL